MKIAIVNSKDLNQCWSALQYTDNCDQCSRIDRCEVRNEYHKNGIVRRARKKKCSLNDEYRRRMSAIIKEEKESLKIYEGDNKR